MASDRMNVLRTPDSRFWDLPDYPFRPRYHQVTDALRLHYVDEGRTDAAPVPYRPVADHQNA